VFGTSCKKNLNSRTNLSAIQQKLANTTGHFKSLTELVTQIANCSPVELSRYHYIPCNLIVDQLHDPVVIVCDNTQHRVRSMEAKDRSA